MTESEFSNLLNSLRALPRETEWVEFKYNKADHEEIGEYLSALANSAGLLGRDSAYMVWGIDDETHDVVGTTFRPRQVKIGNEELENWLTRQLYPRINVQIEEYPVEGRPAVLFVIQACQHTPVRFKDTEWIRVGSYKKKLKDYPEKERRLWLQLTQSRFEDGVAISNVPADEVLRLIDYPGYFDLMKRSLPATRTTIIEQLGAERIIRPALGGSYDVTNLGALLFAKRLNDFPSLARKAVRIIEYEGQSRIKRIKEHLDDRGYAVGFTTLLAYINDRLPSNEVIGQALRHDVRMYPALAVRELLANAVIHQDLTVTGESPLVEIFADRIEFTNPGESLVEPLRFLDAPPRSRNETMAALMRRLGICEEVGSGIDKVVFEVEYYQLPAPDFIMPPGHTKVTLFAHRELSEMDIKEKVRACYLHACLEAVSNRQMTNASLRQRFGIKESNYSIASRIIAETIKAGLIRPYDPESKSKKHARYVPYWA
jgi:ATP-dependent DNA helicase RecG